MKRRVLFILPAMLAGLLVAELGLRLYHPEYEADRTYFGRDAFIADEQLAYRHAPNHRAQLGREHVFGPQTITTNAQGFRDQRLLGEAPENAPVVFMGGASFLFGIGLEDEEALIHRRVEAGLRAKPGFHPGTVVHNVSQTGYMTWEICTLVDQAMQLERPDLVILTLRPNADRRFEAGSIDVVDGYRLPVDRPLKAADPIRTHSHITKRCALSPLLNTEQWATSQLAWRLWKRVTRRGGPRPPPAQPPTMPPGLAELQSRLEGEGIPLVVVMLYYQRQTDTAYSELLRRAGFMVIDIRSDKEAWEIPGDGHWHAEGTRAATEIMLQQLPYTMMEAFHAPVP